MSAQEADLGPIDVVVIAYPPGAPMMSRTPRMSAHMPANTSSV
jgi:hypothetical protein